MPIKPENKLMSFLSAEADAYIQANAMAKVGDIVTTKWGGWKKPRDVRIYRVKAHLVCRFDESARDWIIGFAMTYCAERIRKDGTSAERASGCGIYLHNFTTKDGRQWDFAPCGTDRRRHEEAGFNHAGLYWPRITKKKEPQSD